MLAGTVEKVVSFAWAALITAARMPITARVLVKVRLQSIARPPPAGAGPLQSSHEAVVRDPAYSPGAGSYPLPSFRLFYSAGDPTEREAS